MIPPVEPVKLTIYYFSGTGNTDYVARYLAKHVSALMPAASITLKTTDEHEPEGLSDFDLLVVGFPVYAAKAPEFFRDLVDRLPPGQRRGAYAFGTMGAWAGDAHRGVLGQLEARSYFPLGGADIGMPGSDGLAMVKKGSWFARWAMNKDFEHLRTADQLAEQIAGSLTGVPAGKIANVNPNLLSRVTVPLWAAVYHAMENWMRSSFYADDRCIGCGLCESICPIGAVRIKDGKPRFDSNCVLCLRCIHQCSQEAIQIGRWTVNKFRWRGPKEGYRPPRLRKIDRKTLI